MIGKLFRHHTESVYGLNVFDKRAREWIFTGYYPEREAIKAAENETRRGGRVHIWKATDKRAG